MKSNVSYSRTVASSLVTALSSHGDDMVADVYANEIEFLSAAIDVRQFSNIHGGVATLRVDCIVYTAPNKNTVKIWKNTQSNLHLRTLLFGATL